MKSGITRTTKRTRLFAEQAGLCCYCHEPMELNNSLRPRQGMRWAPKTATFEHLYERGDPRRGTANSIALACLTCNEMWGAERIRTRMLIAKKLNRMKGRKA